MIKLVVFIIPAILLGIIIYRIKNLENIPVDEEPVLQRVIRNDRRAFVLVLMIALFFLTKNVENLLEFIVAILGQVAVIVVMTLITQIECREHFNEQ